MQNALQSLAEPGSVFGRPANSARHAVDTPLPWPSAAQAERCREHGYETRPCCLSEIHHDARAQEDALDVVAQFCKGAGLHDLMWRNERDLDPCLSLRPTSSHY